MRAWIGHKCRMRDVRLASSEEAKPSITIGWWSGQKSLGFVFVSTVRMIPAETNEADGPFGRQPEVQQQRGAG